MGTHDDGDVNRSDLEIAREADLRPLEDVAADLGFGPDAVEPRGEGVGKLTLGAVRSALAKPEEGDAREEGDHTGRTVLVTGMTPTPKGEGKTVTTVGLGQALATVGERAAVAIREPSLGPVFGIKGGAAGGGRSQVLPMESINLHFTGDLHALTSAHGLIAAALDNHLHQCNELGIDPRRVRWPRAVDCNDRALRNAVVGLGGETSGVPREDGYVITAASELTAVLGLAEDLDDLEARIGRIVLAYDETGEPVTPTDLEVAGAAAALLRDAFRPNLVRTNEGVPAFVHGGPFANIAHGTNTLVADRVGEATADYLVTEAGFGADLGAEKFLHIMGRRGVVPDVAVVVASVRALKRHGLDQWPADFDRLDETDPDAAVDGLPNLLEHVRIVESMGVPAVVAINVFPDDAEAELSAVETALASEDVPVARSRVFEKGGEGGIDLAKRVRTAAERGGPFSPLYDLPDPIETKIATVAGEVYGASDVEYVDGAAADVERLAELGYDDLPICVSKTPYSLSDDASLTGVPEGWTLTVRDVSVSAGAGFLVVKTADVMTMPGLPAEPAAEDVGVEDGEIVGLF